MVQQSGDAASRMNRTRSLERDLLAGSFLAQ
jgi:hypothetical protein